uniref:ARID domain-containing protein n=2 Tax=Lutzomyia longipalpis TaxID=7200 RepID=A0A1B0CMQ1_LUTLO
MEVKAFGPPTAYHGPYTFFNQVQIVSFVPSTSGAASPPPQGLNPSPIFAQDPTTKHSQQNNNITTRRKNAIRRCDAVVASEENRRISVLKLGDCIPVRPWSDQQIVCLAEIRMVWRDRNEQCLLIGLRLYFVPENTPMGRTTHGEDEVVAISDRVVIKGDDLLSWLDASLQWNWGFRIDRSTQHSNMPRDEGTAVPCVAVISFSKYCRFRALMKRMENIENEWLKRSLIEALGGNAVDPTCSRIVFCRETFDYPELETHELLCNHLAPKLKGRPRGRRKKTSGSEGHQGGKYGDTSDSESAAESESSSCSSKMNYAKAKLEVQHLRYSQRSQRVRLKTEQSTEVAENDGEISEEKQKAMKEKERKFLMELHQFMAERKTPISKVMWLSLRRVNLYDIYTRVQEFGGYETVSVNRLWKALKRNSPGLTHNKYEKVLLPFELHQRSLQEAEEACKREKLESEEDERGKEDSAPNGQIVGPQKTIKVEKVEPELSKEQMTEIQNKVKAKEQKQHQQQGKECQKMQVSVPVTVIVGSTPGHEEVKTTTSSKQIQIQQPRTTITVHQTTIHPQVSGSGNTTKSSSQQITNQIQITNEIKIQQITLPKGAKSSDSSDNGDEHGSAKGLRHIRVKSNGRKFPENVPTIDLRDSDEEVMINPRVSAMYPPIRKRKLDILREGGLEVTPIRSRDPIPPLKQPRMEARSEQREQQQSVFRKVENIPKFQSKCMFTQSGKIFGNPKENVSQRATSVGGGGGGSSSSTTEVLDLTAKKGSSETGRSGRNHHMGNLASIVPNFPALANPNLMISFVPPAMPNLNDNKAALNYGNFLPHMLAEAARMPGFGLPVAPPGGGGGAPTHPPLNFPQLPPGLTIANLAELNAANMNPYLMSYMYGSEGFLRPPFFDATSKNGK